MAAKEETGEKVNDEIQALKEDIANLRNDLKGLAGALKDTGKDRLSNAKDQVVNRARALEDNVERKVVGAYEDVRDVSEQAVSTARGSIEERPLTAVLGSFLAGMVFAKVMWRD